MNRATLYEELAAFVDLLAYVGVIDDDQKRKATEILDEAVRNETPLRPEMPPLGGVKWDGGTVAVMCACLFVIGFSVCQILHAIFPGFGP